MSKKDTYEEKSKKRLAHVESHLASAFSMKDDCIRNILEGTGSVPNSAAILANHALASGVKSWFIDNDLTTFRRWMHVKARLDKFRFKLVSDTLSPGNRFLQLMAPLLSNDRELIGWFADFDAAYDLTRVENPKTHDFWAYQSMVALRGDWSRLAERCQRVLTDPPKAASEKTYLGDHHFYLALARGEIEEMQKAIETVVTPSVLSSRANDESGYTDGLISTPAVIYSKIAWLHGFEVNIDSPYVPPEWLSMKPLDRYEDTYPFLTA